MPSRRVVAQVRYRVKPMCFHWTLRKRSPCEEEEIRHSANHQDVMLAGNVDDDDESKFDEDQPSAVAPSPATMIGGLDFHFGSAFPGNTLRNGKKSHQLKRRPIVQSAKDVKPCRSEGNSGQAALPDKWNNGTVSACGCSSTVTRLVVGVVAGPVHSAEARANKWGFHSLFQENAQKGQLPEFSRILTFDLLLFVSFYFVSV